MKRPLLRTAVRLTWEPLKRDSLCAAVCTTTSLFNTFIVCRPFVRLPLNIYEPTTQRIFMKFGFIAMSIKGSIYFYFLGIPNAQAKAKNALRAHPWLSIRRVLFSRGCTNRDHCSCGVLNLHGRRSLFLRGYSTYEIGDHCFYGVINVHETSYQTSLLQSALVNLLPRKQDALCLW